MLLKFYELALHRIREQTDQYLHRLAKGSVHTFEEYKEIAGKIFGLRQAEEIIKEIFEDVQMPNKKQKGE